MVIIGIDPGCSGAVVVYHYLAGTIDFLLMPTVENGKSTRVNGLAIREFLVETCRSYKQDEIHVFMERVSAIRKEGRMQGGTSMFTFGHAAGIAEGVLAGLGLPVTLVMPAVWKRHCGLLKQEKDASRLLCLNFYPGLPELKKKGKGQAISDALLIARYGVDMLTAR